MNSNFKNRKNQHDLKQKLSKFTKNKSNRRYKKESNINQNNENNENSQNNENSNYGKIKSIISKFNFTYQYNPQYFNYTDYCMLICKGKKGFLWSHTTNSGMVETIFLEKNNYQDYNQNNKYLIECDPSMSYKNGTLLYGTFLTYQNINCFIIEDILLYLNDVVYGLTFDIKLIMIHQILSEFINNTITIKHTLQISLSPIIELSKIKRHFKQKFEQQFEQEFNKIKNELPIDIYGYQFISKKSNERYLQTTEKLKPKLYKKKFWIKAEKEPDTYLLFKDKECRNIEGYAFIDSYKLSKKMNSLFRIIKENYNLDDLEVSDDEIEFEEIEDDKFLKNNILVMSCVWNSKYQKWIPQPFNNHS